MNKQEANERLNLLEQEVKKLKEIINSPDQIPKEERFWQLILETNSIKRDKKIYPDSTFGFKDKDFLWEFDSKKGYLWLSHKLIWSVLEKEYLLKYDDIQSFIKIEMEQQFNCKEIIPTFGHTRFYHRDGTTI